MTTTHYNQGFGWRVELIVLRFRIQVIDHGVHVWIVVGKICQGFLFVFM